MAAPAASSSVSINVHPPETPNLNGQEKTPNLNGQEKTPNLNGQEKTPNLNGQEKQNLPPSETASRSRLEKSTIAESLPALAQRVELTWLNLTYDVKTRTGPKRIVADVSGCARPGGVLAVMGSSGCGKTSTLNLLCGRQLPEGSVMFGTLTANGMRVQTVEERSLFRRSVAFVMQDDLVMETQTVREVISFSAALRLPRKTPRAQRQQLIAAIIGTLRLDRVANSIVGNINRGGISGGERKRVSIAVEMVTNPSVLILDEPTSGLDAFTALKVMSTLKEAIAAHGRTVIATIHQPASQIFDTFDMLLLMHRGSVAYFGPAAEAAAWFERLGTPCPMHYNPADFFVQTLMEEPESDKPIDFIKAWGESSAHADFIATLAAKNDDEAHAWKPPEYSKGVTWFREVSVISMRNVRNYRRDKMGLRTRIGQTLFFSLFVGGLFFNLTDDYKGIQDRQGLLFFTCVNILLQGTTQVVLMFPIERKVFEREFSAGFYKISSYFFSKTFAELPFHVIPPIVFSLILYGMTGLQSGADKIFTFVGVVVLMMQCAVSLGMFIGCTVPNPEMAVALIPVFIVPLILVGGLLINKERLDPGWLWLEKISMFSYAYEALIVNEFEGLYFYYTEEGVEVVLPGEAVIARLGMGDPVWRNCIALVLWFVIARFLAYISLLFHSFGWRRLLCPCRGTHSSAAPNTSAAAASLSKPAGSSSTLPNKETQRTAA